MVLTQSNIAADGRDLHNELVNNRTIVHRILFFLLFVFGYSRGVCPNVIILN